MKYTDEIINAFLAGDLEHDAKTEFLIDLEIDEELQQRLKFYQEMDQLLGEDDWALTANDSDRKRSKEYQRFLEEDEGKLYFKTIENASNSYFAENNEGKQVFGWFGKLSIAASMLLMISLATFFLLQEPSSTELYLAYKDTSPLPSLINRNEQTALNEISELFNSAQNKKALTILDDYMKKVDKPVNPQLYLYKGEILMRLGRTDEAILTYVDLENSGTIDASKAYWYLALAYLKAGDKSNAKNELTRLIESNSNFNITAAEELLEKLD